MKTLFQLSHIRKSYGSRIILNDVTFAPGDKSKVGVVGRNGAGKSTLFKVVLGREEADGGEIITNEELRLGYLEQQNPYELHETVLEFLLRYTGREDWACGKMAGRFGLKNELLEAKIEDLPGGYRMRAKLTAMLLFEPNFLLLDEPTNYLDLRTLILLEDFLRDWNGGFMIISHDREFIKNTCEETLEVENGEVFHFPGALEEYLAYKIEKREEAERFNRNVEARRAELQNFVDRFRAKASKAKQAQSKMKQLEKLETIAVGTELATVRIRLPKLRPRKGRALVTEDLDIGYGQTAVARKIGLDVGRGEHVAVLGDNGQGKTTLLRTLAGELPPLGGTLRWSAESTIAYYEQHVYAGLDPSIDIFTHLQREAARDVTRQEILDMAGGFLFSGSDVEKPISVLSGGERARVCLAGLLLSRREILLLDEPTNHLDFETAEALAHALRDYAGTILFVSHDRTFVNIVATNIVEVHNGEVLLYPGSYEQYVYNLRERRGSEDGELAQSASTAAGSAASTAAGANQSDPGAPSEVNLKRLRKQWREELKAAKKDLREIEDRMHAAESEKEEILKFMADNPGDFSRERNDRLEALSTEIAELEPAWLELGERIEALERRIESDEV